MLIFAHDLDLSFIFAPQVSAQAERDVNFLDGYFLPGYGIECLANDTIAPPANLRSNILESFHVNIMLTDIVIGRHPGDWRKNRARQRFRQGNRFTRGG
jgi:hypothetical protein